MEQSRRDFLKVCGKVTAGLGFVSVAGLSPQQVPNAAAFDAPACSGTLNWREIRARYFRPSNDYIYMNNSTMGVTLRPVRLAMEETQKLFTEGCTLDRFFSEVLAKLRPIRAKFSEMVNAYDTTPRSGKYVGNVDSVTEGMSLVANGLSFEADDVIFITDHEHAGGRTMWELQRDRYKAKLVQVPLLVDGESQEEWAGNLVERFRKAMGEAPGRPRVVSFPWVTTSTGHVLPARELCAAARDYGAVSVIDAAQAFAVLPIDFQEVGCDFLVVNGHKYLCGPIGSGFICVHPDQVATASSFWPTVVDDAYYYPGTPSRHYPYRKSGISAYTNVLPLMEALGFHLDLGKQTVFDRLQSIGQWLREGLGAYPDTFELITPTRPDISCVMTCFRIRGVHSETVYQRLKNEYGIHVKHSTEGFSLDSLGIVNNTVNGAVRLSPHYYNTRSEFESLKSALCAVAGVAHDSWPQFPG